MAAWRPLRGNTGSARRLRRELTDAERWLWQRLRNRQLLGAKFRRQAAIGPYVVDFVCSEQKLVLEIDGSQHQQQKDHDESRSRWLEQQGYMVLRFWNHEIFKESEAVLTRIVQAIEPDGA